MSVRKCRKSRRAGRLWVMFAGAALAIALLFPFAIADTPTHAKKLALEVVDRNAEAAATVGDVLYYFGRAGHAGVREREIFERHPTVPELKSIE